MRFAPYCTIFGNKRPQKGCKCRPLEINVHFVAFTYYPLLASKQTFARIDFLRQVGRLGTKWVLMALNFLLKILLFALLPRFATGKWGWILDFSVSLFSTSYLRGVAVLVLHHKDNILLSILVYNRVLFALVLHHKDNTLLSILVYNRVLLALVLCHKDNKRLSIDRQTKSQAFLNLKIY